MDCGDFYLNMKYFFTKSQYIFVAIMIIVASSLIFIYGVYIADWYWFNVIADLVPLLTLVTIILYVIATHRQSIEAHRQSEALLKPYLRIQWYNPSQEEKLKKARQGRKDEVGIFQLVNIGKGPAIEIKFINPILVSEEDPIIKLEIKSITAMRAGGNTRISKKQIKIIAWGDLKEENLKLKNNDKNGDFLRNRLKDPDKKDFEIEAVYQNLEEKNFSVIFKRDKTYNDGFCIVKQKKSKE